MYEGKTVDIHATDDDDDDGRMICDNVTEEESCDKTNEKSCDKTDEQSSDRTDEEISDNRDDRSSDRASDKIDDSIGIGTVVDGNNNNGEYVLVVNNNLNPTEPERTVTRDRIMTLSQDRF